MKHLTLILGGNRSGKSQYALEQGGALGPRRYFLGTAQALHEEMAKRIAMQKAKRASDWIAIEESIKVPDVLGFLHKRADVVVVDCLALWISNLLAVRSDPSIEKEVELLIAAILRVDFSIVAVSSEVGCGVVPADPISRLFRDTLGAMHQKLAALSQEVYFMVAGIPLRVSGLSQ